MNILFCQPTLDYTGSETSLLSVIRGLATSGGHRLHVLAGRQGPIAGEFERCTDSLDVVNAPKLRRRIAVVPGFLRSFWTVFRKIRELKKTHDISVVYVNTVMFPQALVGARLNGLECVVHVHEIESKYPWMVYQTYVALATVFARRIICVCEYIPNQRRVLFKEKMRAKTRVVYNASAFDPGPLRRSPEGVLRILSVGTLSRLKGTGDVAKFAGALAKRTGKDGFELVLVGSVHDDNLYNEVMKALREMELDDRVSFTGEQPEIERYYRDAHVLLHLAHSDVFPMVLVEAASFSLPAVSTDAGGCPEAVDHGKTGFVAPVGDVEALARHVAALAADPELHRALSEASYRRYQACFTPDRMIDGIRNVLDGMG
jgi:glycosyltransferase involved in cell wall biosynthesis